MILIVLSTFSEFNYEPSNSSLNICFCVKWMKNKRNKDYQTDFDQPVQAEEQFWRRD